ncbi:MAG TPA: alpha/beta hydrolase [Steroidobacteraceae bacterium]|nr:alpha/beta hydrolase [Steroidobacteraceae bacterium]
MDTPANQSIQIEAPDGTLLSASTYGAAPYGCVLVHGLGDGAYIWSSLLARGHFGSALLPNLRGHGDSAWDPLRRYTRTQYAADLCFMLERVPVRNIVLIGHSLGADIAIRVTAQMPHLVRALILVDGGAYMQASASEYIVSQFLAQPRSYRARDDYASLLECRLPLAERDALRALAGLALRRVSENEWVLKVDPAVGSHLDAPDDATLAPMLASVRCPILVARGAFSAMFNRTSIEKIVPLLHDGQLKTIARSGHSVMLDNPAALAAEMSSFAPVPATFHRGND